MKGKLYFVFVPPIYKLYFPLLYISYLLAHAFDIRL